jgi:hypothetical protein
MTCRSRTPGDADDPVQRHVDVDIFQIVLCYNTLVERECWNWQTGTFEGRVFMTYGFKSRLAHHAIAETMSAVHYPPLVRRVDQLLKESEETPMNYRNEKHRIVFAETIKRMNRKNKALMAALYLLTADFTLWRCVKYAVVNNVICFEQVRLRGTNTKSYPLFCAAKDLYLGTRHLTITDFADTELIPPKVFALICNAMAIRRFGLGAIQYEATGGM